jgi:hypothetical protein
MQATDPSPEDRPGGPEPLPPSPAGSHPLDALARLLLLASVRRAARGGGLAPPASSAERANGNPK